MERIPPGIEEQEEGRDIEEGPENTRSTEEDEKTEALPLGLVETSDLAEKLSEENLDAIYKWYAEAMTRRERNPLEQGRFVYHFFEGGSWEPTVAFGDMERGYLFGFHKNGVFIPTHFAPKSMRGGYLLFDELAKNNDLPVVTAITDDLAKTLLKMKGWHTLRTKFLSYFSEEIKEKVVVYNSAKGVRRKLVSLVKEFWEETRKLKTAA